MKKFGLLLAIIVLMWNRGGRVEADSCVVAPGVYCNAATCGVWYQPPNNCSTNVTHCDYYDPSELTQKTIPGCTDPGVRCDPPGCIDTYNCVWDDTYGCQIDQNKGGTSCMYCYDQGNVCTCTDANGEELACCYPCSDGSGCDGTTGGGGGGGNDCIVTYPKQATLVSPIDESTVSGDTVTLRWQAPTSWGSACPENDNHYLLNVWDVTASQWVKDSQGNNYDHKVIAADTTSENVPLSGLAGHHIRWRVITDNGSAENDGEAWDFYVLAGVTGRVYLDADNSCSTSQPSGFGGGLTASLRGTSYSDGERR